MAYNEMTVFINQILDQKGITGIENDVREQLVSDLESRLMTQINRAIVEAVPAEKLQEFTALTEKTDNDAEVQEFLASTGVDTQAIATNTMVQFKNAYLGAN